MPSNSDIQRPLQPDIFTYNITTSWSYKNSLLGLPRELRENIYFYLVEYEQENQRKYVGKHRNSDISDLCTPLFKIRPPALVRVCKTLREEYLPYYFKATCFRVYIDIACPYTEYRVHIPSEWTILDKATGSLLESLQPKYEICFRNVQFRLVDHNSQPVGASLNIQYNARSQKYTCDFKIDDGWDAMLSLNDALTRNPFGIIICPKLAWVALRAASQEKRKDVYDWKMMKEMTELFQQCDLVRKVHISAVMTYPLVEEWSDETGVNSITIAKSV